MEIEGKSTEGFSIRDAQDILKGRPGEAVSIGILHKGDEEVTSVPLVRELIKMQTVLGNQYKKDASWDFMLDQEAIVQIDSIDKLKSELSRLLDEESYRVTLENNTARLSNNAEQLLEAYTRLIVK